MAQFLYALTASNIDRVSKSFHCQHQEKICNNTITKDPTSKFSPNSESEINNCENRLIFDGVKAYKKLCHFWGHPVCIYREKR